MPSAAPYAALAYAFKITKSGTEPGAAARPSGRGHGDRAGGRFRHVKSGGRFVHRRRKLGLDVEFGFDDLVERELELEFERIVVRNGPR